MSKDSTTYPHSDITEQIIGAYYAVYNGLGFGFQEKVYGNAMVIEIECRGLEVIPGQPIKVHYSGHIIGEYFADLVVADLVILELKTVRALVDAHEAQLLNYLKATPYEIGLLLNFGPKPEIKRRIFSNARKAWRPPLPPHAPS